MGRPINRETVHEASQLVFFHATHVILKSNNLKGIIYHGKL